MRISDYMDICEQLSRDRASLESQLQALQAELDALKHDHERAMNTVRTYLCGDPEDKRRIRELEAELALLSDKACTAVMGYRAALGTLTDSFKYPAEVVSIARNALASTENREDEHG